MASRQSAETFTPLSDRELAEAEQRARTLPKAWPRQVLLRLIAEVRRARAGTGPVASPPKAAEPQSPSFDPDYRPPGGRVTMTEWKATAARLKGESGTGSFALSPHELEERRRRWEQLRAQLGWDSQRPLTPAQER